MTVLLPVYNAAAWLSEAVNSILRQSFREFELLVMDDGSTDGSTELLTRYPDPRLRVMSYRKNRGLVAVLNDGIDAAGGDFIARMDADDVSHPLRLQRQVAFLDLHPQVGVCGTWFRAYGRKWPTGVRPPTAHDDLSALLFFRSPFGHPTVMMRRALLLKSGIRYDSLAAHAEDFDLWVKLRPHTRFANLPAYLLRYRVHPAQAATEHGKAQAEAASQIRLRQLAVMLPAATQAEKQLHLQSCDGYVFRSVAELRAARGWLDFLQATNGQLKLFPERAFGRALATVWTHCCARATLGKTEVVRTFLSRRYAYAGLESLKQQAGLIYRVFRG